MGIRPVRILTSEVQEGEPNSDKTKEEITKQDPPPQPKQNFGEIIIKNTSTS